MSLHARQLKVRQPASMCLIGKLFAYQPRNFVYSALLFSTFAELPMRLGRGSGIFT
jgi:hypothetical protein